MSIYFTFEFAKARQEDLALKFITSGEGKVFAFGPQSHLIEQYSSAAVRRESSQIPQQMLDPACCTLLIIPPVDLYLYCSYSVIATFPLIFSLYFAEDGTIKLHESSQPPRDTDIITFPEDSIFYLVHGLSAVKRHDTSKTLPAKER